jgi:hypothetical protein
MVFRKLGKAAVVEFRTFRKRTNGDRFERRFWLISSRSSCQFWIVSWIRSVFLFSNSYRLWNALAFALRHVEVGVIGCWIAFVINFGVARAKAAESLGTLNSSHCLQMG